METINIEQAREMLLYVADEIIAAKSYLTDIDSQIGDGDHGIGMAGGMQKVKVKLEYQNFDSVYAVFETAGRAMIMSMGGASGVIFGSLYQAGAKGMPPAAKINAADLAAMFRKSLEAIKQRGQAEVGDKTMIDALEPAVLVMEAATSENVGEDILSILKEAEEAARQGMEATKEYIARFGRAKSLMERSIGFQDAGATSVWLIFQGMRKYIEKTVA